MIIFVAALLIAAESAPNLMGLAELITSIGVAFASIVGAIVLVTTRRTEAKLAATDEKVTQIDHAVNGKAPGKLPMVDQVEDLHDEIPGGRQGGVDQAALLPLVRRLVALAEAESEADE